MKESVTVTFVTDPTTSDLPISEILGELPEETPTTPTEGADAPILEPVEQMSPPPALPVPEEVKESDGEIEAKWFFDHLPHNQHREEIAALVQDEKTTLPIVMLTAISLVIERKYFGDVRRLLPASLSSMTTFMPIECKPCGETFMPIAIGQRYCCNACGAKAAGYSPVVDHSERCLLGSFPKAA